MSILIDKKIIDQACKDIESASGDFEKLSSGFIASLTSALSTFEGETKDVLIENKIGNPDGEKQDTLVYFLEKQIIINDGENMLLSPNSFTVLCHSFADIKARVEYYESIGEIDALKEDITRLNSNGAIYRLEYLKQVGEPYKTPEGKYSNIPFKLRRFNNKYPSFGMQENAMPVINIESFPQTTSEEIPQVNRKLLV